MISQWPTSDLSSQDQNSVKLVEQMQQIITEVRRFRNDQGIKSTAKVAARFTGLSKVGLESYEAAIRLLNSYIDAIVINLYIPIM